VADLGGGGELLLVQGGVGAGELHLTGQELLAAGAGAGGVVADVEIAALGLHEALEGLGPGGLRIAHGGGAGAGEASAELGVAAGGCAAGVGGVASRIGAATAGGQGDPGGETERGERDEPVLANVPCESFRGRAPRSCPSRRCDSRDAKDGR